MQRGGGGGGGISCSREGKIKQVRSVFPLGATQGACTRVGGWGDSVVSISWNCQQGHSLNGSCCFATCRGVEQSDLQNRFLRMRALPANDYRRSLVVGIFHELV